MCVESRNRFPTLQPLYTSAFQAICGEWGAQRSFDHQQIRCQFLDSQLKSAQQFCCALNRGITKWTLLTGHLLRPLRQSDHSLQTGTVKMPRGAISTDRTCRNVEFSKINVGAFKYSTIYIIITYYTLNGRKVNWELGNAENKEADLTYLTFV